MPVEESENTSNQISKEEEVNENFLKIEREKISNYVKYTFDFGKCKEKRWCDVDKDYQDWILKTKDVWLKRKDLWIALYEAGVVKEEP